MLTKFQRKALRKKYEAEKALTEFITFLQNGALPSMVHRKIEMVSEKLPNFRGIRPVTMIKISYNLPTPQDQLTTRIVLIFDDLTGNDTTGEDGMYYREVVDQEGSAYTPFNILETRVESSCWFNTCTWLYCTLVDMGLKGEPSEKLNILRSEIKLGLRW